MNQPPGNLQQQSEDFGQEITRLLAATLPGLPDPPVEIITRRGKTVVRPRTRPERLPLYVDGQPLASLELSYLCRLDSFSQWLAVERSTFGLYANVDRAPVLRIDFLRDAYRAPSAHVQVHGHRGALSHLLSQAGHATPHDMSALHIPVGGHRFRPCLEDFIEFLVAECRFDSKRQWRRHVREGRTRWRQGQAAAVCRDSPEIAARVLKHLGYEVTPPAEPPAAAPAKVWENW